MKSQIDEVADDGNDKHDDSVQYCRSMRENVIYLGFIPMIKYNFIPHCHLLLTCENK